MTEYELVWEIQNLCRNNQMRDVFFEEVACDDPEQFVRSRFQGKEISLSSDPGPNGQITIHATVDGLIQRFIFTPI